MSTIICRRLNSKTRDVPNEPNFITEKKQDLEMEEHMWRYPYRGNGVSGQHFTSAASQNSVLSSLSRELPPIHREKRYTYVIHLYLNYNYNSSSWKRNCKVVLRKRNYKKQKRSNGKVTFFAFICSSSRRLRNRKPIKT